MLVEQECPIDADDVVEAQDDPQRKHKRRKHNQKAHQRKDKTNEQRKEKR